jgi:hypothetical protein
MQWQTRCRRGLMSRHEVVKDLQKVMINSNRSPRFRIEVLSGGRQSHLDHGFQDNGPGDRNQALHRNAKGQELVCTLQYHEVGSHATSRAGVRRFLPGAVV